MKIFVFYIGIHSGVYPGHISRSSSDLRSHAARTHSRTPSMDLRHSRNSSADLNKFFKNEINVLNNAGPPGMLYCLLYHYHQLSFVDVFVCVCVCVCLPNCSATLMWSCLYIYVCPVFPLIIYSLPLSPLL